MIEPVGLELKMFFCLARDMKDRVFHNSQRVRKLYQPWLYLVVILMCFNCSVIHALSNINLYEDEVEETPGPGDDLSNAISDPTTQ